MTTAPITTTLTFHPTADEIRTERRRQPRIDQSVNFDADLNLLTGEQLRRFIATAHRQEARQLELAGRHRLRADLWERYPATADSFRLMAATCAAIADTIARRRELAQAALDRLA